MHLPDLKLNKLFIEQMAANAPKDEKMSLNGSNPRRLDLKRKRDREEQAFEIIKRIIRDERMTSYSNSQQDEMIIREGDSIHLNNHEDTIFE